MLAYLRRAARQRQRSKDAFTAWWKESAPDQYKPLKLSAVTTCPPELALPRRTLQHLLAARSHHGDDADYREWLDHADALGPLFLRATQGTGSHLPLRQSAAALADQNGGVTHGWNHPRQLV
jgi:hypothetical protein